MTNFVQAAKDFQSTTREGDMVLVAAPAGSMAEQYNGSKGEIAEYAQGGWITVNLEELGARRFRADELKVL